MIASRCESSFRFVVRDCHGDLYPGPVLDIYGACQHTDHAEILVGRILDPDSINPGWLLYYALGTNAIRAILAMLEKRSLPPIAQENRS